MFIFTTAHRLISVLSQMTLAPTVPPHFLKLKLILPLHLHFLSSMHSLPFRFINTSCVYIYHCSNMYHMLSHFILDFFILIAFGKKYSMKPPTMPYFLASHNLPLSDQDILLTPYSHTLSVYTHPLM